MDDDGDALCRRMSQILEKNGVPAFASYDTSESVVWVWTGWIQDGLSDVQQWRVRAPGALGPAGGAGPGSG